MPNTSPLLLNINIGSKYYAMFVLFLKHVSHYMRWRNKFGQFMPFFTSFIWAFCGQYQWSVPPSLIKKTKYVFLIFAGSTTARKCDMHFALTPLWCRRAVTWLPYQGKVVTCAWSSAVNKSLGFEIRRKIDYAGIYKNALIIKSQLRFEKWENFVLQVIYKFAQRKLIKPVRKSSNWS